MHMYNIMYVCVAEKSLWYEGYVKVRVYVLVYIIQYVHVKDVSIQLFSMCISI